MLAERVRNKPFFKVTPSRKAWRAQIRSTVGNGTDSELETNTRHSSLWQEMQHWYVWGNIFWIKKSTPVGLSSSPMALSGPIGMAWHSHLQCCCSAPPEPSEWGLMSIPSTFSFRHGKSCDNNHRKVLHSRLADGSVRKAQCEKIRIAQLQFRIATRPQVSTVSIHLLINKS